MKKIFIYVQACELRALDAKKISAYLSLNNYNIVDKPEDADAIILFTCAVSSKDAKYSLDKVKELQKYDAELIVAGCLPAIEKEELAKIFSGKTIITKNLKDIIQFFPEDKATFDSIHDANTLFQNFDKIKSFRFIKKIIGKIRILENIFIKIKNNLFRNILGENSIFYQRLQTKSYFIRISGGCLGNCTYCGIKKAIGPHKSKPLDVCVREFRKGLDKGYKHFNLISDDTGAYGSDIGSSFPELLDELTKIDDDYEISVRTVSPYWVVKYVDELVEIIKKGKITSIGIPVQSGSSRILRLMNRYSDTEKMKDAIIKLRKAYPDIALSTNVIIGFPTEIEEEFRESLRFVMEVEFRFGVIFPFSCRDGTKSVEIEPKVPEEEIMKRIKYTKKFLKKAGYVVINKTKNHPILFDKKY